MKHFMIGWILGLMVAGAGISMVWGSAITSGAAFEIGTSLYACKIVKVVVQ